MKAIFLAGALALCGSAAIAQDMPTPPPPPAPGAQPMQDGMTPPPPAPGAQPMDQPMGQPMNQPMGQGGMSNGNVQFAPMQTTPPPAPRTDYPVCSRTVTDGCRQPRG